VYLAAFRCVIGNLPARSSFRLEGLRSLDIDVVLKGTEMSRRCACFLKMTDNAELSIPQRDRSTYRELCADALPRGKISPIAVSMLQRYRCYCNIRPHGDIARNVTGPIHLLGNISDRSSFLRASFPLLRVTRFLERDHERIFESKDDVIF